MAKEIIEIEANVDQLRKQLEAIEKDLKGVDNQASKTGKAIGDNFSKATTDLTKAQKELETITKTIKEQEKITDEFRRELARLELEYKKLGKSGTIAGLQVEKQMDHLKATIKEQVIDVRQLKREQSENKATVKALEQEAKARDKVNDEMKEQKGLAGDMKSAFNSLGKTIVAAVAVSEIIDFADEVKDLAIEMQQMDQRARIVFGESLPGVEREARKAANALGLTRREFTGAAAGVADILVPLGFARDVSADLAVETTKLAGAISNWSAGQYTAAESTEILQKALVGETEQLKSVGIVVDQSSKQYNERIKVLMETENITQQQARALDILDQVTNQSLDAQTAYSTGQDNIAIKMAESNARAREAKEALAEVITPVIVELTEQYADTLDSITERLTAFAATGVSGLFDRETGQEILATNIRLREFQEGVESTIATMDDADLQDYFTQATSEMIALVNESELEEEVLQKIRDDNFGILNALFLQREERGKINDEVSEEEVKQVSILQAIKDTISELDKQILAATDINTIYDLNAQKIRQQIRLKEIEAGLDKQRLDIETRIAAADRPLEEAAIDEPEDFDIQLPEDPFGTEDVSLFPIDESALEDFDAYYDAALEKNAEFLHKKEQGDKDAAEKEKELNRLKNEAIVSSASQMFGALAQLAGENAEAQKAFATFQAILDAYLAIQNAIASVPYPANIVAAAAIGVQAFANVAKIQNQQPPSYFHGTDFLQLGNNPKGKDTIPVMAHEGEAIIPSSENKKYPGLSTAWVKGDLDRYIAVKHVLPALERQKEEQAKAQARMVGNSVTGGLLQVTGMKDDRIVDAIRRGNLIQEEIAESFKKKKRNPYRA